jgi:hypothetical protein
MRRIQHLRPAFIAQKGFSTPTKDAMEGVIESKKEEVLEQVTVQLEEKKDEIAQKVDEVADKVEATVEKTGEEVGKKLEEAAKPIADIIDKLDDNPQIAKALDIVGDVLEEQLNGRELSCSCFGWLVALRISRRNPPPAPSKPEETPQKAQTESQPQHTEVKEQSPPSSPPS